MQQQSDTPAWRTPAVERLAETLLRFDDRDELLRFLRDICSQSELQVIAQRLEVARLVDRSVPYARIAKEIGASTATVTRVAQWLRDGEGGYRIALDREREGGEV